MMNILDITYIYTKIKTKGVLKQNLSS